MDKKEIKTGGAPGGGGGGGAKPELSRREREEIDKARGQEISEGICGVFNSPK